MIGPNLNNFRSEIYEWILQCNWREDIDADYLDELTDRSLIRSLNCNYSGGFKQFIKDSAFN